MVISIGEKLTQKRELRLTPDIELGNIMLYLSFSVTVRQRSRGYRIPTN